MARFGMRSPKEGIDLTDSKIAPESHLTGPENFGSNQLDTVIVPDAANGERNKGSNGLNGETSTNGEFETAKEPEASITIELQAH